MNSAKKELASIQGSTAAQGATVRPRAIMRCGRAQVLLWSLFLAGVLCGCATRSSIPVVERMQPPTEKINTHWVSEGETLYAIAWRYNLDAGQLAAANGLNESSRINRGQTLRLDVVRAKRERRALAATQSVRHKPVGSTATRKPAVTSKVSPVALKSKGKSQSKSQSASLAALDSWRWPTQGRLLKRFSYAGSAGHKGLDISGASGQPVYAAQNGLVVYAGAGLPAYGNLLIVKHSDTYLSAYAHNSRLAVREGDSVKAGQKVAELGRSGTSHEHLHFEIRKHGVPVNPLRLLPKTG